MLNSFPVYKSGDVLKIKLKPKDKKILDDFLIYCSGSAGIKKVENIKRIMLQVYDVSQISFNEWSLEHLRKFLSVLNNSGKSNATTNDIKKVLKRFLKEYYEDWNTRFKGFKDSSIKMKDEVNHKKHNSATMLKPEDFEILVKSAEVLKYKCFIALAWESAGRPEELLKLKWKDINLEKGEVKLDSSKTNKVREVPLKDCLIHLKRYKEDFPYPNRTQDDYIFVSPVNRKKSINIMTIHSYLKTLGKRKLNRIDLTPYLFRHTRLSFLMKKLSPKSYEMFSGHSIETANKFYSHLDKDDVREEMFEKVFKIEEFTEEQKEELKQLKEKIKVLELTLKEVSEYIPLLSAISPHKEYLKKLAKKHPDKKISVNFNIED